ncbi:Aste57867_15026 [Aphanomyces stellatus]|uniref:Aste57867_15026 protein n=1 Tax=Aphanomyces stellatus TaxID=120398 RepID=A0A485L3Z6_9STRA|nr:hypothetical protein As57867_014970 [Aphanomyces stellatus]VFT91840.1 Aste57867_15026 [Aphanomyces stellatus]
MEEGVATSPNGSNKAHRQTYTISFKRKALSMLKDMSIRQVAALIGVHHTTIMNWKRRSNELLAFKGNKKGSNLPGAGRPTIIPEPQTLMEFMQARRHQERALTLDLNVHGTTETGVWLLSLLQDFCGRHGYTHQLACKAKKVLAELESTRDAFSKEFHGKYGSYDDSSVYNVHLVEAWKRRQVVKGREASYRMTAVLAIRRDGTKLPILFVIKGQAGAVIESNEFQTYPPEHNYTMQNKAWMDGDVWEQYLWNVPVYLKFPRSLYVLLLHGRSA